MSKINIPKNLDNCFAELSEILISEDIEEFKNTKEESVSKFHHGLGRSLRNRWGLWHGSCLAKWFNSQGIQHPDDMSGIIMKSFWRYLHSKPIELDEQIEYYQSYWKAIGISTNSVE